MFRSAVATLLLMISPTFASAQEVDRGQQRTHEVVKGETLWTLADRYLGNPYRWPLIFEANADQIENPNIVEPGQVLVIPGVGGEVALVRGVEVTTLVEPPVSQEVRPAPPTARREATGPVALCPGPGDRTLFFPENAEGRRCQRVLPSPGQRTPFYPTRADQPDVQRMAIMATPRGRASVQAVRTSAVPLGLMYGAEWLDPPGTENEAMGMISGFSLLFASRTPDGPARMGESVVITLGGPEILQPGDLLQSFRTIRTERNLGAVRQPTGILVVTEVAGEEIRARVSSELDRIWLGDMVRMAPEHDLRDGVFPVPVESHLTATIIGFPQERGVQGLGARVFLDVGTDMGVGIGDVFRAHVERPGSGFGMEAARLQVVWAAEGRSTARIIDMKHPGVMVGHLLRLIAKMQ